MKNIKQRLINALKTGVNELENCESAVFLSKKKISREELNKTVNIGIDLLSHYANRETFKFIDLAVITSYQKVSMKLMDQIRKENYAIISA